MSPAYPYAGGYRVVPVMQPGMTRRGASEGLVLGADGLRSFVGLFSDTSMDAVLEEISGAAQELVGAYTGIPLGGTPVEDFFPPAPSGRVLLLSQRGRLAAGSVAARYVGQDGTDQDIATTALYVDETTEPPRITLLDAAPAAELYNPHAQNPLVIAYKMADFGGFGQDSMRMTITEIVQVLYFARGEGNVPDARALDRIVMHACRHLQRSPV